MRNRASNVVVLASTLVLSVLVAAGFYVLLADGVSDRTAGSPAIGDLTLSAPIVIRESVAAVSTRDADTLDSTTQTPVWIYRPIQTEADALAAAGKTMPDDVMVAASIARLMPKEAAELLVGGPIGYPAGIPTWVVAMTLHQEYPVSSIIQRPVGTPLPSAEMVDVVNFAYDATTGRLIGQGVLDDDDYSRIAQASNEPMTINTATLDVYHPSTLSPSDLTDTPNQ